jgi:hypothetical protein
MGKGEERAASNMASLPPQRGGACVCVYGPRLNRRQAAEVWFAITTGISR